MRMVLAALALGLATPAGAVTYIAEMRGIIDQQFDLSFNDPNMSVGEAVLLTARFDADSIFDDDLGPLGVLPVAHLELPASGEQFLKIASASFVWSGGDNRLLPGYPWMSFEKGKITGLYGDLLQAETDAKPELTLWGGLGSVVSGNNVDLNNYVSPGFRITWDLAGSKITAVPEPATWAMMIAGFGMVGGAMRRRGVPCAA